MHLPFDFEILVSRWPVYLPEVALLLLFAVVVFLFVRPVDTDSEDLDEAGKVPAGRRALFWLKQNRGFLVFAGISGAVAALGGLIGGFGLAAYAIFLLALVWTILGLIASSLLPGVLKNSMVVVLYPIAALILFGVDMELVRYLDAVTFPVGTHTVTAWGIIAGVTVLLITIWLAFGVSRIIEGRIRQVSVLSPSLQVLVVKVIRTVLLVLAVIIAVGSMGFDLTALTVFGGAIGLGLGFGLQKVVSNFVCGFVLLMDRSVKPGDVIQIESTYGWVNNLNARYVSLITRDGTEHLIPNEDLVTLRVVNWSFTNNLVRIRTPIGISYKSDPHEAIRLIEAAAADEPRILKDPQPVAQVLGFGDS